MEYRAAREGLPAPADLLGRYPLLRGDTDSLVELLAWGARLEAGDTGGRGSGFDLSSLAREFPDLGGAIAARLAALDGELEGTFPLQRVPEGYVFLRELERGGMSRVALVWNEAEQRQEVLKLNDPAASDRPDAVVRFRQEIEIASRVTGGRVVPVHRAGRHNGLLFYTMPYLAGGSLRDRFKAHAAGLPDGVRILAEVSRVVQKLHEH
jgi:serine/threonine-protein kinase